MTIINVNFRDKEHYALVKLVEAQLEIFGLNTYAMQVPEDAIACALDEVKVFPDAKMRKIALEKLEEHFRQRRASQQGQVVNFKV